MDEGRRALSERPLPSEKEAKSGKAGAALKQKEDERPFWMLEAEEGVDEWEKEQVKLRNELRGYLFQAEGRRPLPAKAKEMVEEICGSIRAEHEAKKSTSGSSKD